MTAKQLVKALLLALVNGITTDDLDRMIVAIYRLETERESLAEQLFISRAQVYVMQHKDRKPTQFKHRANHLYSAE